MQSMVKKTKSGGKIFLAAAIVLIALIVLFFGSAIYNFAREKYLLSAYPTQYTDYVEKYSGENDIDKFLVYAIIKTESNFNSDAVSEAGARGLMQIMSDTFDWIKYRLGDGDEVVFDDMFDPEQNIRYGCYLIGYLLDRFKTTDLSVCAYHAGAGNVEAWLNNENYSSDGAKLDVIPISDTEHYLNKVNKSYDIYKNLYGGY